MIKNVAWDTKEKKISAVIFTVIFLSLYFFETMRASFNEITEILFIALGGILFSLFYITSIEGKWNRLFSAQGIIAVATVVVTLGMAESYSIGTTTTAGMLIMFVAPVFLFMVQKIFFVPVVAIVSVVMASMITKPDIQMMVLTCIPAAIGMSCISFSKEIKESAIWKKIIFAVSQIAMLVSYGYTVYCRRFTITFHSLKTEVWDSVASFIAVIVLLVFAVYALKNKKPAFEIIGYLVIALTGIVPMFMEMKYAFFSAMAIYMVMLRASKEGSLADDVFNDTVKLFNPKNRKKTKPKKKKI